MLSYTIIRTQRKTVGLSVDSAGALTVRAPLRMAKRDIDRIIADKHDWIIRAQQQANETPVHRFLPGETFFYLGQACPLRYGTHATLDNGALVVPQTTDVRAELLALYRQEAKLYLPERVHALAASLKLPPPMVRVSSARNRWGSCSSRGTINLSLRAMQLPEDVLDYLLIHELCHITHMNHSPVFWALVGARYPDYPTAIQYLRENGRALMAW